MRPEYGTHVPGRDHSRIRRLSRDECTSLLGSVAGD